MADILVTPDSYVFSIEGQDFATMPYEALLYFPTGGSKLTITHLEALMTLRVLSGDLGAPFYSVLGVASRLGSPAANQALSLRRMKAGVEGLNAAGVPVSQIVSAQARGEDVAAAAGVPDGNNDPMWRSCAVSLFSRNPRSFTARLRTQMQIRAYASA